MNWEAIKHIYRHILIYNNKIKYLGGDRYKIISFYPTGEKHWEKEYKNKQLYGKNVGWYQNGQKNWERKYKSGQLHGKYITWYKNGQKYWEIEYQNGEEIE